MCLNGMQTVCGIINKKDYTMPRKQSPLNQADFNMKIVEDLGTKYLTDKSKTKTRVAIFECSRCKRNMTVGASSVKTYKQSLCASCKSRETSTTHGKTRTRRCYE